MKKCTLNLIICLFGMSIGLFGCGGNRSEDNVVATPSASSGQVAPTVAIAPIGFYAASRFAEQASFGPSAALVAEIRQKGFEKWIDDQLSLSPTQIDPSPFLGFVDPTPDSDWAAWHSAFPNIATSAPDQLRGRVTWAISQFVVTNDRKGDLVGVLYWVNMLQKNALGNYSDLLYAVARNPHMAQFLDNDQNRPKSTECPNCAPNENFAREIMQLFSLGVFKLNPDGTPALSASGNYLETYTQRDVEALARVLTGWRHDDTPPNRPNRNWGNWGKSMVPTTWPPERDSGAKTVIGKYFPAGQSQDKDLLDAIAMLMAHQNIAPFVATRMIQHLVKSNPTPAYVGRVAAKFRNNGQGVAGDMKAVVKAILLDTEARAGDSPASARVDDGKFREPFLHHTAVWRGLECTRFPDQSWGGVALPENQRPFHAESVFSFYAPTDRAPGSNLLAPEQRLADASEFTERLNLSNGKRWDPATRQKNLRLFTAAGCHIDDLITAYAASPKSFNDFLSERFFRGAMPPTLRSNIEQLIKQPQWDTKDPSEGALIMLDFALTSPYFGVMQ